MAKLCLFLVAICFVSQLPQNEAILPIVKEWIPQPVKKFILRDSGCISCFRYITKLYYDNLEKVSPECSPEKYKKLGEISRYTSSYGIPLKICFNNYPDEFKEEIGKLQNQAETVLGEFIECFQKTGLKQEDKSSLDNFSNEFETERKYCQNPEMQNEYLKSENNDVLQTFRDNYAKILEKPAESDSKTTLDVQSNPSSTPADASKSETPTSHSGTDQLSTSPAVDQYPMKSTTSKDASRNGQMSNNPFISGAHQLNNPSASGQYPLKSTPTSDTSDNGRIRNDQFTSGANQEDNPPASDPMTSSDRRTNENGISSPGLSGQLRNQMDTIPSRSTSANYLQQNSALDRDTPPGWN